MGKLLVLLKGTGISLTLAALFRLYKEICKGLHRPGKHVLKLRTGGALVAECLKKHGVKHLFVLSGGHIAPVYCASFDEGINVVDVRHEVNTVFAADAMYRLTGIPGVAAITAGPGVTNTVTAVKNAQMAESAVVILGGAAGTMIKGRGALQDIDHVTLMKPLVKLCLSPTCVAEIVPAVERAFRVAQEGVPGPVFVELPLDLTWPAEEVIRNMEQLMPKPGKLFNNLVRWFLYRQLNMIYHNAASSIASIPSPLPTYQPSKTTVKRVMALLKGSKRPVIVIGSQCMLVQGDASNLVDAITKIGVPMFCAGMARGLLWGSEAKSLEFRHKRSAALKKADLVILAGSICDFRLQYGFCINSNAKLVCVNRSRANATMNRIPDVCAVCDTALFLSELARCGARWTPNDEWVQELRRNDAERVQAISKNAEASTSSMLNPVRLCLEIDGYFSSPCTLVMDGGDFVGTAANIVNPRGPLCWLDPGPFGTLGVGAGFAMAAKLARPEQEVWIFYGDGALGFSIAEIDTFVRFKLGIICIVGNDGGWTQIARDQERVLQNMTACKLAHTNYHTVAEGFGAKGFVVTSNAQLLHAVCEAKKHAAEGTPCLINCLIARNDFREGSISV